MTPVSATRMVKLTVTRITAAIASWLRHLSDRVHQDGDALARQHAWIITATTGRFGFAAASIEIHGSADLSSRHVAPTGSAQAPGGHHDRRKLIQHGK